MTGPLGQIGNLYSLDLSDNGTCLLFGDVIFSPRVFYLQAYLRFWGLGSKDFAFGGVQKI